MGRGGSEQAKGVIGRGQAHVQVLLNETESKMWWGGMGWYGVGWEGWGRGCGKMWQAVVGWKGMHSTQDAQLRRLPSTVVPHQPHALPRLHVPRDSSQNLLRLSIA